MTVDGNSRAFEGNSGHATRRDVIINVTVDVTVGVTVGVTAPQLVQAERREARDGIIFRDGAELVTARVMRGEAAPATTGSLEGDASDGYASSHSVAVPLGV